MPSKHHFSTIIFCLAVFLLLGVSALLGEEQEDQLFTPTGPFSIGVTSHQWIDESRDEIFSLNPENKRAITVWIWYPAEVDAGAAPRAYLPDGDVESIVRVCARWFASDATATLEALSQIRLNAVQNAALTDAYETFPIVVYSNGLTPLPSTHSFQVEELASHGYVVLSVTHTLGFDISVKDSIRVGDVNFSFLALTKRMGEDIFFVLDQLEALNTSDAESMFAGRLALDRIGIAGYSFGGDVALWATRQDDRLAAALVEDGYPEEGRNLYSEVEQPVLFMLSERPKLMNYYHRLSGPGYVMKADGIRHSTYLDQALWPKRDPITDGMFGTMEHSRAVHIINTYALAFFDQYLKGVEQPILMGPSSEYPEVTLESRNTA